MSVGPKNHPELTERVDAAAPEPIGSEEHVLGFIRPWRLYEDRRRQTNELVSCGACGCGISPNLK